MSNADHGTLLEALSCLDLFSTIKKKCVCATWKDSCETATDSKNRKKAFVDDKEPQKIARKCCDSNCNNAEVIVDECAAPLENGMVSHARWIVLGVAQRRRQ